MNIFKENKKGELTDFEGFICCIIMIVILVLLM